MANHGDWQFGIYFNGLAGQKPSLPMHYDALERAAEQAMSQEVWSPTRTRPRPSSWGWMPS